MQFNNKCYSKSVICLNEFQGAANYILTENLYYEGGAEEVCFKTYYSESEVTCVIKFQDDNQRNQYFLTQNDYYGGGDEE